MHVSLAYSPEKLLITTWDNGVGFNPNKVSQGSGLMNMESRAKLIGVDYSIFSEENVGVKLTLGYNFNHNEI